MFSEGWRHSRQGGDFRRQARKLRPDATCGDFRIERGRGALRRDAQLRLQDARTFCILPQGGWPLARLGVERHDLAVRRLVQRVYGQPAPRVVQGGLNLSPRRESARQPVQGAVELPTQDLALVVLPIVEAEAVPQAETLQEITAAEGHGITQRAEAVRANTGGPVPMGFARGQPSPKLEEVHPGARPRLQPYRVSVGQEPFAPQRLVER